MISRIWGEYMRITFNLMSCGLGNNGGSMTIVRSANTLCDLGHKVYIIDTYKNMHTWNKLKASHIKVKKPSDIPDSDAVIATGFKTVRSTVELPSRCGLAFHWIRGWETWNMNENKIVKDVLLQPTFKMVNSVSLQKKLKKYDVNSHIVMPGYDFGELYPLDLRKCNRNIILGGLLSTGKHIEGKRTDWIFEAAKVLKKKHKNLELWMLTSEKKTKNPIIDRYFRSPTMEEKNMFYNRCDIWLAPTQREGLHMPPAEAMITGCPVAGTDAELSGMKDYLIPGITGTVSPTSDRSEWIERINWLIERPQVRIKYGKTAQKVIEHIGDRKTNMEHMVDILKGKL